MITIKWGKVKENQVNIINVFLCMVKGVIKPKYYNRAALASKPVMIIYAIIMSVITTAIFWGVFYLSLNAPSGLLSQATHFIKNTMQPFEYADGVLVNEESYSEELSSGTFVVDTSFKELDKNLVAGMKANYNWSMGKAIVILNSESVGIINNAGSSSSIKYSEIVSTLGMPSSFDNDGLVNWLKASIGKGILYLGAITIPIYIIVAIIVALLYALVGFVLMKILHGTYSFWDNFKIAILVTAFTTLIERLIQASPLTVPSNILTLVIIVITLAYFVVALISSSTDDAGGTIKLDKPKKGMGLGDLESPSAGAFNATPEPAPRRTYSAPAPAPAPKPAPVVEPVATQSYVEPTPAPAPVVEPVKPAYTAPAPAPTPVAEPVKPVYEAPAYTAPTPAPAPVAEPVKPAYEAPAYTAPAPTPVVEPVRPTYTEPTYTAPTPAATTGSLLYSSTSNNTTASTQSTPVTGSLLLNRGSSNSSTQAPTGSALFGSSSQTASAPVTGSALMSRNPAPAPQPTYSAPAQPTPVAEVPVKPSVPHVSDPNAGFNSYVPSAANTEQIVDEGAALGSYGSYSTKESDLSANSPMNVFLQKRKRFDDGPKEDSLSSIFGAQGASELTGQQTAPQSQMQQYSDGQTYGQTYKAGSQTTQFGASMPPKSSSGMGMANDDDFDKWMRENYPNG